METLLAILYEVVTEPSIMIGLVALIGLVSQRQPTTECIKGTIKCIVGFVVFGAGAQLVVQSLESFSTIFEQAFGMSGVVPNNEAIVAIAQKDYGREMALILPTAMLVNIVLARFTPLKYIFLTGHHTLFMSMLVAVILSTAGITGLNMVIIGSLVVGISMVVFPAIGQPFMRKVTGDDSVAIGHFSTISYALSGLVAKYAGDKSHSTEELNVPQSLLFLRDTPVAISVTIGIIFMVACLVAGPEFVENISDGKNYLLFAAMQSILFAGGVYIILQGVKMVISEIVPAFKGISDKLVPDAKPALDVPVLFPYAPNAVLIGFLSSLAAGVLGLFVLVALNQTAIIPGVVPHFFIGAGSGVIGNAMGGVRGTVLGSFAQGLLLTFLPLLLLPVLGELGIANATFCDSDLTIVGILLGVVVR